MSNCFRKFPFGSFFMSLVFGILLPTGDVFTDIVTLVKAIRFNGDGWIFSGCNSCYDENLHPSPFISTCSNTTIGYHYDAGSNTWIPSRDARKNYDSNQNKSTCYHIYRNYGISHDGLDDCVVLDFKESHRQRCTFIRTAGVCMLIPMLFNFLFSIRQWRRDYKKEKTSLSTLPILICQCYPQWQLIRILYAH